MHTKIVAPLIAALFISLAGQAQQTVGLFTRASASQDGYVLFSPITSNNTYLIDKCGKSVHTWTGTRKPGQSVYLQEDGSLLRPAAANNTTFNAGGSGGIIERYDWNGNKTWGYTISSASECQHHDVCQLPNGNILAIVWESKTAAEAAAAGRNPAQTGTKLWSEKIVELQPSGAGSATVVWEWHVWEHLVQEYDAAKANYGAVTQHPELINLNYNGVAGTGSDWLHINSVAYNPALNQIMLSVHNFSEIWIIDHSTTMAQASGHSYGARGKGGDLLYRWGNPAAYSRGTTADRIFYTQHNAHWIESGLPDSGKIMVFNNGQGRPGGNYSTVDVFAPPADAAGNYSLSSSAAFGPSALSWQYKAANPTDFYSQNISGAQRLSNGNTLICEGTSGNFFEVDAAGSIVWKYVNPITLTGAVSQGTAPTQNATFRCTQYSANYAGLAGKALTPGAPLEQNPLSYICGMGTTGLAALKHGAAIATAVLSGDALTVRFGGAVPEATVTLWNMMGQKVQSWTGVSAARNASCVLNINTGLAPGLYLMELKAGGVRQVLKAAY